MWYRSVYNQTVSDAWRYYNPETTSVKQLELAYDRQTATDVN